MLHSLRSGVAKKSKKRLRKLKRMLQFSKSRAFSINIPKEWVNKNALAPQTELEVVDKGHMLMIATKQKISLPPTKKHVFTTQNIDEIYFTITGIYRKGYKEVELVFENHTADLIDSVTEFVGNFQGVVCEVNDNCLTFYDKNDHSKCMSILKKGFQTALILCDHLNVNPKTNDWWNELLEGYKRLFFLTEFVFRLIGTEHYSDVCNTMKLYCMAWVLQCIGEIIKRIGKYELQFEKKNEKGFFNEGHDLKIFGKVLREVYDVCYSNKSVTVFYNMKNVIEEKLREEKSDYLFIEYYVIFSYLCAKMIKQQMVG